MDLKQIVNDIYGIEDSCYHGIEESVIKEIEEKLQLIIPETLRNYYLLYGNNRELNFYDELFKPQDIFIDNTQETQYLVIGKRYIANYFYGINIGDLHEKSPAIYTKSSVRIKGISGKY